jgi:glycosyltransferase involved in cell wall biosynthesis
MSDPNTQSSLKILMITCFPFFSSRGTPIAVKTRLEVLSELGHEVDVVAYHVGDDIKLPGVKILRIINIPFIKEVPVGPSLKKIFLDIFVFFKTLRLLIKKRYDLLHTHEEANYFGAIFSKIFKIRHLLDFHGSIPQIMINLGYGRLRPLIYVLEQVEKPIINSSHGLITISTDLDAYIRKINDKILTVIIEDSQNYDFSSIDKERLASFKLSHPELDDKNIVLYAGTFELYQGLELLLASAELVIKKRENTIFVLAGGRQNQIDTLRESTEKRGIAPHFHFPGNLPIDELALFMNIAKILVSTRTIGNNPPSKIYDYLRAGKPIVATNINAHTQILNEDIAVMVDLTPESIASGILSILENPSYAKALGQKSRDFFEKNFSIEKKMEKTRQILDAVMQENI